MSFIFFHILTAKVRCFLQSLFMIISANNFCRNSKAILMLICLGTLFMSCQPFQAFEYKGVSDWKIQTKSFAESKLSGTVNVFNPNKYQVTIKRIEANILVNGSEWSQYQVDSSFSVPAQSQFSFPVQLRVKNSNLLTGLSRLATGKELPYELKGKIKGTYRSITAEVPFVYSGKFTEQDIRF